MIFKLKIDNKLRINASIFTIFFIILYLLPFTTFDNSEVIIAGIISLIIFVLLLLFFHWYFQNCIPEISFFNKPYYAKLFYITGLGKKIIQKEMTNILISE